MSKMCKMNEKCSSGSGMCVHEKMMLVIMLLMAAGGAGFWLLGSGVAS